MLIEFDPSFYTKFAKFIIIPILYIQCQVFFGKMGMRFLENKQHIQLLMCYIVPKEKVCYYILVLRGEGRAVCFLRLMKLL